MDEEDERVVVCSSAAYCYFCLSVVLFSVGTVLTILSLEEEGLFAPFSHMWLVGPLFISSGLMVALKTIMYLRRETMLMFLTRQRTLITEFHYPALEMECSRSCSNLTRPPSYDTVVQPEPPPPTYEEAALLKQQPAG